MKPFSAKIFVFNLQQNKTAQFKCFNSVLYFATDISYLRVTVPSSGRYDVNSSRLCLFTTWSK